MDFKRRTRFGWILVNLVGLYYAGISSSDAIAKQKFGEIYFMVSKISPEPELRTMRLLSYYIQN